MQESLAEAIDEVKGRGNVKLLKGDGFYYATLNSDPSKTVARAKSSEALRSKLIKSGYAIIRETSIRDSRTNKDKCPACDCTDLVYIRGGRYKCNKCHKISKATVEEAWKDGYWDGPMKDGYPSSYFDKGHMEYPWQKDLGQAKASIPSQVMAAAQQIVARHDAGAEADAGFDAGEFSGPAHHRALVRELKALAAKNGVDFDVLTNALGLSGIEETRRAQSRAEQDHMFDMLSRPGGPKLEALRPFSKMDWDSNAGADAPQPGSLSGRPGQGKPGTDDSPLIDEVDFDGLGGTVIVDRNAVQVILVGPNDEDVIFRLDTPFAQGKALAAQLAREQPSIDRLKDYGFERIA